MALALDGLRVIDADTHLTEAHDLWTKRAPAKYADRVPHVEGDRRPSRCGSSTVRRWASPAAAASSTARAARAGRSRRSTSGRRTRSTWAPSTPRRASRSWTTRASGPRSVSPTPSGSAGRGSRTSSRTPCSGSCACRSTTTPWPRCRPTRVSGCCPCRCCPAWSVDECVAEAKRVASLDLRGVNMTSDPQDVGGPDLANRAWDPLWEVCADLHLPVHFHIGASLTTMTYFGTYPWESQDDDTKLAIGGTLLFIGNARVVTNIILSGMLDRHPKLQMVSVESGVGWIPFILEALDYEMSENAPKQLAHMSMLPSEYFKRNLFATFWFEKNNMPALIDIGRGGQRPLRDGLPPPDLPLPQAARDGGREDVGAHARGAAQDPGRERGQAVPAVAPRATSGCPGRRRRPGRQQRGSLAGRGKSRSTLPRRGCLLPRTGCACLRSPSPRPVPWASSASLRRWARGDLNPHILSDTGT